MAKKKAATRTARPMTTKIVKQRRGRLDPRERLYSRIGALEKSSVLRKGASEDSWYVERARCDVSANKIGGIDIFFRIPSKGGGDSCLWLEVDGHDLRRMLLGVADKNPATVALFAECTAKAGDKYRRMVEKVSDGKVVASLKSVGDFVGTVQGGDANNRLDKEAASDSLYRVIETIGNLQFI